MNRSIKKAAVLGAGVMGAGIAAHLAGAGLEVLLLDRVPEGAGEGQRSRLAQEALVRLGKTKPSPLYSKKATERIATGNFEDDWERLKEADWIIEVIVERLDAKQALLERVEAVRRQGALVSSNTSGISIRRMAEGRSEEFRRCFMGTHFFNPPRYMKLLELIPGPDTDPECAAFLAEFCRKQLGKGVVYAKDTPNFIANRIGTYGLLATLTEMERHGLSVADVDALTGPALGRPKSATFRTLDLVGLDTFLRVAQNVRDGVLDPLEKKAFEPPELLKLLEGRGWLGEKSGQGFYKVETGPGGKSILYYDLTKDEYAPKGTVVPAAAAAAKQAKGGVRGRIQAMLGAGDPGGAFVWNVLKKTLLYAAAKVPEIADDAPSVDAAMRWGFNWELGPFELWDALGVRQSVARMEEEGETIPAWVREMLASGKEAFYGKDDSGKKVHVLPSGSLGRLEEPVEAISLAELKQAGRRIKGNAGASLIDLGDDVACLEFHSVNSTIGPDVLQMILQSLEEVRSRYKGLVIGHQGKNFCVGANLMLLLMEAQDENWPEIERMIDAFHNVAMALKYFEKPVVSAPFQMTLGGGVEMCLPAARVQASAETYMGLVEFGVGVIPAGGGTKEMLYRSTGPVDFDGKVDLQPFVNRVFETIGMAKVSTSAQEAKELGYLRPGDGITMNDGLLLYDAKQAVLGMSAMGFAPPVRERLRVVGEPGLAVMQLGIYQLRCAGQISEHDARIAGKLAHVLAGGKVPANAYVTEEYLLSLEKEAFLSLCGEPKTQARMEHMLLQRKPLRN